MSDKNWAVICYSTHDMKAVKCSRYANKKSARDALVNLAKLQQGNVVRDNKTDDSITLEFNKDRTHAVLSWGNGSFAYTWDVLEHTARGKHRNNRRNRNRPNYDRHSKMSIEEVEVLYLWYKRTGKPNALVSKYNEKSGSTEIIEVDMSDDRYANFFENGTDCVNCGLKGEYFWLEKTVGDGHDKYSNYHFNLYGIKENGKEEMLTKDHRRPVSKGGKDVLSNYQPMCATCNELKGNKFEEETDEK